MKLHMPRRDHVAAPEALRAAASTRKNSLRQAVDGALSSLEALGERLQRTARLARDAPLDDKATNRLREVLDRDRALIAANPELTEPTRDAALARSEPASPPRTEAVEPQPDVLATPSEPAHAPSATRLEEPPKAAPGLPPPPPALLEKPAPPACNEPIRTRTMARLLASQGHPQRALSIYEFLLTKPGADDALRAEADALRQVIVRELRS